MQNRVELACSLITSLHSGMHDASGKPLVGHLKDVADKVSRFSTSPYKTEAYLAALLHESGNEGAVAEGQAILNASYIEKFFGSKVSFIIEELRKNKGVSEETLKSLSLEAQEIIMAKSLATLDTNPRSVKVLSVLKDSNPAIYNEAKDKIEPVEKAGLSSAALFKIKTIIGYNK